MESQLPINEQHHGDDLSGVDPQHFAEFDAALAAANDAEGIPVTEQAVNGDGYQPTQAAQVSGAEILAPVVGLACNILAPSWDIQPEEQQALAESYGALVDKYFPEGAGAFGVELNALIITGAIFGPRIGKPRKPEKPKTVDHKQEAANDD